MFGVLLVVFALPHLLYAFIYTRSQAFLGICNSYGGHDAVHVFKNLSSALKILQFSVLAYWVSTVNGGLLLWEIPSIMSIFIIGSIISLGQLLNLSVYRTIGMEGVYYGSRLGKRIEWCHGFPFSVVSHPQYVGSLISWWGVFLGLHMFSLILDTSHLVILTVQTFFMYLITAVIEELF